jgi:hypothetical protein
MMLPNKRSLRPRIVCGAAAHSLHLRLFFRCICRLKDVVNFIHIPAPRRNALVRPISKPRKPSYPNTTYH